MNNNYENEFQEENGQRAKIIDITDKVKVIATKTAPYHEEGEEIELAPAVAEKMIKNKWATPTK